MSTVYRHFESLLEVGHLESSVRSNPHGRTELKDACEFEEIDVAIWEDVRVERSGRAAGTTSPARLLCRVTGVRESQSPCSPTRRLLRGPDDVLSHGRGAGGFTRPDADARTALGPGRRADTAHTCGHDTRLRRRRAPTGGLPRPVGTPECRPPRPRGRLPRRRQDRPRLLPHTYRVAEGGKGLAGTRGDLRGRPTDGDELPGNARLRSAGSSRTVRSTFLFEVEWNGGGTRFRGVRTIPRGWGGPREATRFQSGIASIGLAWTVERGP